MSAEIPSGGVAQRAVISISKETPKPDGPTVMMRTAGLGGVVGLKRKYYSQRFAVDFSGGDLALIGKDTKIKPVLSTSAGRIGLVT